MINLCNKPLLCLPHKDAENLKLAYGACWEACLAEFNIAANLINAASLDPSPRSVWLAIY